MAEEQVNSPVEESTTTAPDDDTLAAGLVIGDESEAVAETPAEETPAEKPAEETAPAAEVTQPVTEATAAEETPAEPPAEKPKPGTPDKALQKLQMEQSAVSRQLAAIHELIQQQGAATPKQIEKVAALTEKASELDTLLAKPEFDPFTDAPAGLKIVSKQVVGQDSRIAALEQRVQQAEAIAAQAQEETAWSKVEAQYPGVDVRAKWSEARAAAKAEGFEADLDKRANYIFHELAKAAKTVVPPATTTAAKPAVTTPPKAQAKPAPTARTAPPTTPGGASVTVKSGAISRAAPVSDEAQTESLLKKLVN